MIILGIDPGTARMGWGVVKLKIKSEKLKIKDVKSLNRYVGLLGYGSVVTEKEDGVGKRLGILQKELRSLLRSHKPNIMAVERLFFGMNAKTAIAVGQATGVILLT